MNLQAKRLTTARELKGWSVRIAALWLRIDEFELRQLESGQKKIKKDQIKHISKVYDIPLSWF